jgi:hypothetical protein
MPHGRNEKAMTGIFRPQPEEVCDFDQGAGLRFPSGVLIPKLWIVALGDFLR